MGRGIVVVGATEVDVVGGAVVPGAAVVGGGAEIGPVVAGAPVDVVVVESTVLTVVRGDSVPAGSFVQAADATANAARTPQTDVIRAITAR